MLCTFDLSSSFGHRTLFQGLNLTAQRGALTALVGPSGSGKSTLLNYLGLLAPPAAGHVEFDGIDLTALRPRAARLFRQQELGYLFQNYALIEDATVQENLAVALPPYGRHSRRAVPAMDEALARVGLTVGLRQAVSTLSGGEQQRVAVARLLLKGPSLVLADEPTGALDAANGAAVVTLLRGLADTGACVVIATHDPAVRAACDAVVRLDGVEETVPAPATDAGLAVAV